MEVICNLYKLFSYQISVSVLLSQMNYKLFLLFYCLYYLHKMYCTFYEISLILKFNSIFYYRMVKISYINSVRDIVPKIPQTAHQSTLILLAVGNKVKALPLNWSSHLKKEDSKKHLIKKTVRISSEIFINHL